MMLKPLHEKCDATIARRARPTYDGPVAPNFQRFGRNDFFHFFTHDAQSVHYTKPMFFTSPSELCFPSWNNFIPQ